MANSNSDFDGLGLGSLGLGGLGGGAPGNTSRPFIRQASSLFSSTGNLGLMYQHGHPYLSQPSIVAAAYAPYQQYNHSMNSASTSSLAGLAGSNGNSLLQGQSQGQGQGQGRTSQPPVTASPSLHAQLQQHLSLNSTKPDKKVVDDGSSAIIRDVWKGNIYEEFRTIRSLARSGYNFIAVDTEFPGAPCRPIGTFRSVSDYQYQILRVNCNVLRIIQIGITLMDENGHLPNGIATWQFNFKFSLSDDMYGGDSIDLLQNSGLQFNRMEKEGIDPKTFAEFLYTSGLVLNDDMKWLSFHSGYDFGYLYRVLMDQPIPNDEERFFDLLKSFFPHVYDVKYLMKSCKTLKGGLQELADELKVNRIGPSHQAGSDSLLTGLVYFKLREMYFENLVEDEKYNGRLYGLAGNYHNYPFGSVIYGPGTYVPLGEAIPPPSSIISSPAASDHYKAIPRAPHFAMQTFIAAVKENENPAGHVGQKTEHQHQDNVVESFKLENGKTENDGSSDQDPTTILDNFLNF